MEDFLEDIAAKEHIKDFSLYNSNSSDEFNAIFTSLSTSGFITAIKNDDITFKDKFDHSLEDCDQRIEEILEKMSTNKEQRRKKLSFKCI